MPFNNKNAFDFNKVDESSFYNIEHALQSKYRGKLLIPPCIRQVLPTRLPFNIKSFGFFHVSDPTLKLVRSLSLF